MEEARRFLRYVIPGLVFIIEILATLLLMDFKFFIQLLSQFKDVGTVLGIFIASGGLGYLFSNAYFWVYWSWPIQHCLAINHEAVIRSLGNKIEIKDAFGRTQTSRSLGKSKSWVIINVYWHTHLKESTLIEGVNKKNDQMSDITHGLGGTAIATFAAALTCLFIRFSPVMNIDCGNGWWLAGLWLFFVVPTLVQFYRTHKVFQAMVNSTFANEIITKYETNENQPVTLIVSK